jgi:hypothetical protein
MTGKERLQEIKNEIRALADEALDIVRMNCPRIQGERGRAYWYPHIVMALDTKNDYLGSDGATIQEAIDSIDNPEDEDEAANDDGGDPAIL